MKRSMVAILFVLLTSFIYGQEKTETNEIQTLFSSHQGIGFYGGFSLGYSQIDNQDALVSGGRLALIFNHSTAIGLAGYGFVNDLDSYEWNNEAEVRLSLAGGYGGLFVEPILNGLKPVHLSFPVLLGIGGITQIAKIPSGDWGYPTYESIEEDLFFIVEPAIELEFNMARFFRTALTVSYRYTSDIELTVVTDPDVLKGLHFGLNFKFGKF